MNASGVSQSGRLEGSQAEIAVAWRRRDCDTSAFASALCAATVPADLAASRICSLWKVAAHDPQYFRSERMDVPQILQMLSGFGAAGAGGIGAPPWVSQFRRCVRRVAGGFLRSELGKVDQRVCASHSAEGATARRQIGAVWQRSDAKCAI